MSETIEFIRKKKLCPFMSDSKDKVYCTEECAIVHTYHDPDTHQLIGVSCGMSGVDDILEKLEEIQNSIE